MKRVPIVAFLLVVATACTQTSSIDTPQATTTSDAVTSNAQVTYTVRQIANVPGAVDIVERRSEDNWIYIVGRNGIVERWNRSSNTRIDQVLDMQSFTTAEGERGLLGLAFRERNNSWTAFVNYTNTDGNTTIAAFPVRDDGTFDATLPSGIEILIVEQPYANHNGGGIAVGPDNMVYIGLGDGGSGGDPQRYALDTSSLLGKMLRINPRDNGGYDIPSDNPYVATTGARGEIWSIGLRNPWRYSFDTQGNLWIADVGQGELEEINVAPANGAIPGGRGVSFGWSAYEGSKRFNQDVTSLGALMPVHVYPHIDGACSVSGGALGTNTATPSRAGWFFFGDYCTGKVTAILTDGVTTVLEEPVADGFSSISAVRVTSSALYVVSLNGPVHEIRVVRQ